MLQPDSCEALLAALACAHVARRSGYDICLRFTGRASDFKFDPPDKPHYELSAPLSTSRAGLKEAVLGPFHVTRPHLERDNKPRLGPVQVAWSWDVLGALGFFAFQSELLSMPSG